MPTEPHWCKHQQIQIKNQLVQEHQDCSEMNPLPGHSGQAARELTSRLASDAAFKGTLRQFRS